MPFYGEVEGGVPAAFVLFTVEAVEAPRLRLGGVELEVGASLLFSAQLRNVAPAEGVRLVYDLWNITDPLPGRFRCRAGWAGSSRPGAPVLLGRQVVPRHGGPML